MALPIDAVYEVFGFLRRTRVDVAQQPIQRERAAPDQVWRIFDGLWWHSIHRHFIVAPLTNWQWVCLKSDARCRAGGTPL